MKRTFPVPNGWLPTVLIVSLLTLAGCNGSAPDVATTAPEFVQVIDLDGQRRAIPAGELIDPETGAPSARQVLSLDRQTGQQRWVSVEVVLRDPPTIARYIPLTETERNVKTEE